VCVARGPIVFKVALCVCLSAELALAAGSFVKKKVFKTNVARDLRLHSIRRTHRADSLKAQVWCQDEPVESG